MNPKEAYAFLDVSEDISDDELKKQYKQLSKKYHPDLYKDDPDKFKRINEAYQLIRDYRDNPHKYRAQGGFTGHSGIDFNAIFNGGVFNFGRNKPSAKQHHYPPIELKISLSFKESVVGATKQIEFDRFVKCEACNGNGLEFKHNGCSGCNGFGRVIGGSGGMMYSSSCQKCYGRNVQNVKCDKCQAKGTIKSHSNLSVNIPTGIADKATLRLQGVGNYGGSSMFGDEYNAAMILVSVEKDPDLTLIGSDVVCGVDLSLVDVLVGCERSVRTINGEQSITIPKLSKNKDEVILDGLGIPGSGNQRVILNVIYPTDVNGLIEYLTKEKN